MRNKTIKNKAIRTEYGATDFVKYIAKVCNETIEIES